MYATHHDKINTPFFLITTPYKITAIMRNSKNRHKYTVRTSCIYQYFLEIIFCKINNWYWWCYASFNKEKRTAGKHDNGGGYDQIVWISHRASTVSWLLLHIVEHAIIAAVVKRDCKNKLNSGIEVSLYHLVPPQSPISLTGCLLQ